MSTLPCRAPHRIALPLPADLPEADRSRIAAHVATTLNCLIADARRQHAAEAVTR